MAEGMNKVILIGNLGQDPEMRHTHGGTSVMTLRMVTTDRYKDREGEWKERPEWHTVVVWGARADGLASWLFKGALLSVEGRLQTRSWDAKDGSKRYTTEVVADKVLVLKTPRREQAEEPSGASWEGEGVGEDDIPF